MRKLAGKKQVGRNIAQARKDKGWTQTELAEKLGTTRVSVANWETGVATPARIDEIAKVLEVELRDLLYAQSIDIEDGVYQDIVSDLSSIKSCLDDDDVVVRVGSVELDDIVRRVVSDGITVLLHTILYLRKGDNIGTTHDTQKNYQKRRNKMGI